MEISAKELRSKPGQIIKQAARGTEEKQEQKKEQKNE